MCYATYDKPGLHYSTHLLTSGRPRSASLMARPHRGSAGQAMANLSMLVRSTTSTKPAACRHHHTHTHTHKNYCQMFIISVHMYVYYLHTGGFQRVLIASLLEKHVSKHVSNNNSFFTISSRLIFCTGMALFEARATPGRNSSHSSTVLQAVPGGARWGSAGPRSGEGRNIVQIMTTRVQAQA